MSNNYCEIKVSETTAQQLIPVDIYTSAAKREPVLREWTLEVKQNKGFLDKLPWSKSKINVPLGLSIADIADPSGKIVFSPDKFITLGINGVVMEMGRNARLDTVLTAESTPMQMWVNTGAIRDCLAEMSAQDRTFVITFKLVLTDSQNNSLIGEMAVNVNIMFQRTLRAPRLEVIASPKSLKYDPSLTNVQIGSIDILNYSDFDYTPEIDVLCTFKALHGMEELPADIIRADFSRMKVVGVQPNTFRAYRIPTNRHSKYDFRVNVPIVADLSKISNPYFTESKSMEFKLEAKVLYNNSCNPQVANEVSDSDTFRLEHNVEKPQLSVSVTDRNLQVHPIEDGKILAMNKIVFQAQQNFSSVFAINIENTARNGTNDIGVYIRNLTYDVKMPPSTVIAPNTLTKNDVVQLLNVGTGEIALPNGENAAARLDLVFSPTKLRELYMQNQLMPNAPRNYNVMVSVRIEFDYYIDERGDHVVPGRFEDGQQHFAFNINLPLYQAPNPDWLAVDFGTSAIVSQYGDGDRKRIIDLHAQKNKLYADTETDYYEHGTPFLSSNIVFRNIQTMPGQPLMSQLSTDAVEGRDYSQLAVCLSPTTDTERANIRNVLPYLKLLVGYDLLPNIDNYKDFKYCYKPAGEEAEPQRVGLQLPGEYIDEAEYTPLAQVDKVFEEVYNELFTYYISPAIKEEARKINQIVLTIPNTYTPRHIERINGIVRKALKGINIRNVQFVSESDAVACYYQKNWMPINKRYGRDKDMQLLDCENVLVYDMGAGTLDVTLFTRRRINGKLQIKVIGKIGIAKAGNYLDTLLAQILSEKIPSLAAFVDPKQLEGDIMIEAFRLKDYVKHVVKPTLSSGASALVIPKNRNWKIAEDVEIDIEADILNHPDFVRYVQDCTSSLINNFRAFFGVNNIQIDTVLLSGRSSKLKPLQAALKRTLADWGTPTMQTIEVSALTEPDDAFDKAKTIVTEGAIKYATIFSDNSDVEFISDNITANYGILYEDSIGALKYCELLNPRRMAPESVKQREGMLVKTYRTSPTYVDLTGATKMLLVQSYTDKVAEEWEAGRREYITVMDEFDLRGELGFDKRNAPLSIHVTEDNILYLYAGTNRSEPNCASKIDINSLSNRLSLWPVMTK